jgi:hypothetical protein
MSDEQRRKLAASAQALVSNLEEVAQEEEDEEEDEVSSREEPDLLDEQAEEDETPDLPDGEGRTLLCLGGRGEIDDAAAAMLAQVLEVQGAVATSASHVALEPGNVGLLDLKNADTAVVIFLNSRSAAHARYAVRRLKRAKHGLRVGILLPRLEGDDGAPLTAEAVNADFVATSVAEAVISGLADKKAVPLKATVNRLSRKHTRPKTPAAVRA